MSETRNGNSLPPTGSGGNQLGGFSPLPSPSGNGAGASDSDQMNVPGVGNIQRGPTPVHTEHSHDRAVYDKLDNAAKMLDHIRVEMDKLTVMADTVAPEDVIAAAGRLVGHGIAARDIATILADMPAQAGQGLAAWIAQQDAAVTQQEMHVAQMRQIAQHRMGVSAIRQLAAEHLLGAAQKQAAGAAALAPRGRGTPAPAGPAAAMPQPQVIQMAQAPGRQGPGAEEAV